MDETKSSTSTELSTEPKQNESEGDNNDHSKSTEAHTQSEIVFKKPIFIGKIGKAPKKLTENSKFNLANKQVDPNSPAEQLLKSRLEALKAEPSQSKEETSSDTPRPTLNYTEPEWSGLPQSNNVQYQFEVIKSGMVVEKINLMEKKFWVIGRLETCDIILAHPSISRQHAIMQYKATASNDRPEGFYIYDLTSTHGTFLNKNRVKPTLFVPVKVGFQVKFGNSTRNFILQGPDEDAEPESELTVTELKAKRVQDLKEKALEKEREELLAAEAAEKMRVKEEQAGIDWGMGEDADEETDLSHNPFAMTNNEETFFDDPKKTLRGFFEREGLELNYAVEERGIGQFLCKVELPIDDSIGRPLVAEVLTKGKKKEAVVQCALEACRMLDRAGVLRQSQPEARKRKTKNWEDNDFYDSDEDEFFDRTGSIERKRKNRMKKLGKIEQTVETYESLLQKERGILEKIVKVQEELEKTEEVVRRQEDESLNDDQDALDSFMSNLKKDVPDKSTLHKLTAQLTAFKQEHTNVTKLINIAKPISLPPLSAQSTTKHSTIARKMPMIGKRIKLKQTVPSVNKTLEPEPMDVGGDIEENEEGEEMTDDAQKKKKCKDEKSLTISKLDSCGNESNKRLESNKSNKIEDVRFNKLTGMSDNTEKKRFGDEKLEELSDLNKLETAQMDDSENESNKRLESIQSTEIESSLPYGLITKNETTEFSNLQSRSLSPPAEKLEIERPKPVLGPKLSKQSLTTLSGSSEMSGGLEKRSKTSKKKEMKFEEDSEKYSSWLPPEGQSGDGKTKLNEKFGY